MLRTCKTSALPHYSSTFTVTHNLTPLPLTMTILPAALENPRSPSPGSIVEPRQAVTPFKGVIFDLDGTLVDSTATLVGSANYALEKLGLPTYSIDEIRPMLGGGTRKLVQRALTKALGYAPDEELLNRGCALKLEFENTKQGQDSKVPFDYVHEMLRELQAANIQMAVLSNTSETNVRKLVSKHFGYIDWAHVAGARDDTPLKPNPFAALRIQRSQMNGLKPADIVFVGDSEFDMKTGRAAEMTSLAVVWGIRGEDTLVQNGAHAVAGSMSDISNFITGGSAANYSAEFKFV